MIYLLQIEFMFVENNENQLGLKQDKCKLNMKNMYCIDKFTLLDYMLNQYMGGTESYLIN